MAGPTTRWSGGSSIDATRLDADADTDGDDFVASLGLGYDWSRDALTFGPYARLTYYESNIDGYTEGGTGATELALKVDDQSVESLTSSIGARLSYAISQSFGVIIPQIRAEWVHEYSNDARDIAATYVFDPNQIPLLAKTNDPDRDYGYIGVGVSSVLPQGRQLFLDYQGLVGYRDLEDHRIVAGLRLEF
jgi:outer membrane autotransporter protein